MCLWRLFEQIFFAVEQFTGKWQKAGIISSIELF